MCKRLLSANKKGPFLRDLDISDVKGALEWLDVVLKTEWTKGCIFELTCLHKLSKASAKGRAIVES